MGAFEAKLSSKGQITLPARLRSAMRLETGDKVVFTVEADGAVRLEAKNGSLRDLKGIISSGPRVSGAQIAGWIDMARARATPAGPRKIRR